LIKDQEYFVEFFFQLHQLILKTLRGNFHCLLLKPSTGCLTREGCRYLLGCILHSCDELLVHAFAMLGVTSIPTTQTMDFINTHDACTKELGNVLSICSAATWVSCFNFLYHLHNPIGTVQYLSRWIHLLNPLGVAQETVNSILARANPGYFASQ
jgi:hypothetical protein